MGESDGAPSDARAGARARRVPGSTVSLPRRTPTPKAGVSVEARVRKGPPRPSRLEDVGHLPRPAPLREHAVRPGEPQAVGPSPALAVGVRADEGLRQRLTHRAHGIGRIDVEEVRIDEERFGARRADVVDVEVRRDAHDPHLGVRENVAQVGDEERLRLDDVGVHVCPVPHEASRSHGGLRPTEPGDLRTYARPVLIAWTAAWVRAVMLSFAKIRLMWFLTVF